MSLQIRRCGGCGTSSRSGVDSRGRGGSSTPSTTTSTTPHHHHHHHQHRHQHRQQQQMPPWMSRLDNFLYDKLMMETHTCACVSVSVSACVSVCVLRRMASISTLLTHSLHSPHWTLYSAQCTLHNHTSHYTMPFRTQSTLDIAHSTLYTVKCTLHNHTKHYITHSLHNYKASTLFTE